MRGAKVLSSVTVPLIIGLCFPTYTQGTVSYITGQYGGYMGGTTQFQQTSVRSRLDCARTCSNRVDCEGYMFDPATNRCHTLGHTLTSTTGLVPTAGASYDIKFLRGTFICPPLDGQYHYVQFAGSEYLQVKAVHINRTYKDAAAECEATGGRLFLLNNADKKSLFINLAGCPDWNRKYRVDGSNENAVDYNDVDAFKTKSGDVVPVTSLLWRGPVGSWLYYYPTTEHCLYFHSTHFHTSLCTSTEYYMCEK